jgi:hypothetical protein
MEKKFRAKEIAENFNRNIQSLIVFTEIVGNFADQHDRKVRKTVTDFLVDLASTFDEIIGDSSDEVKSNLGNEEKQTSKGEKLSKEQKHKSAEKLTKVLADNRQQILDISRKYGRTPPIQGSLLRRSTLISLMSTLETLISQLLREFYHKHPGALPSEAKSLSLADLRDLGSVEEAEAFLIDNEIDSILRGNIQSQLACFEKPIKVSLKPIEKYSEKLIEASQRRNLLVHNDGRINRHYLSKAPTSLIDDGVKEGDPIQVVSSYLLSRIQMVQLVGTILIQQCFRKWEKENIDTLNSMLIGLLFDSLVEKNYAFTESLAEYINSIDIKNDRDLRIMVVNHCIALREQGKLEEMEGVLSKYDWSAVALNFELALTALRSQEDKIYAILDNAILIGEIDSSNLNEWPLFSNFRNTERFKEYFKEKFPGFKDSSLEEVNDIEESEEWGEIKA